MLKPNFTTNIEENKEFQALFITNVLFLMSSVDFTLIGKMYFSPKFLFFWVEIFIIP
jgi:hypothetical protein